MTDFILEPLEAEVTPEDFDAFVMLEDNIDHNWELIDGEMVEKMVSHPRSSLIGGNMFFFVKQHVRAHQLGYVTMADGGYKVKRNRLIPDIGFVSRERYLEAVEQGYQTVAPDLAIEVLSPSDNIRKVQKKAATYLEGGVVVWLVDPDGETVIVYHPDKLPQTFKRDDTLDGGDVLVGFSLALSELFEL